MSSTIPSDYPLTNILHPGVNDILCGRGGATNAHPGNIKFRKLVAAHKLRYLAATKCDKPAVAKDVVREWRAMDPPGRFLAKMDSKSDEVGGGESNNNEKTNNAKAPEYWHDIGDKKAREKASQCLRERNGAANEVVANLALRELQPPAVHEERAVFRGFAGAVRRPSRHLFRKRAAEAMASDGGITRDPKLYERS